MSINTLKQLKQARKEKEIAIKSIHDNYQKDRNMGWIELTKDIVNQVIPNKLNKILDQFNNELVNKAEKIKKEALKEISSQEIKWKEDMESILQVLGAGFKDRKEILNLRKTTIKVGDSDERIIATLSDGKFQELSEAERVSGQEYLDLETKLKELDKKREEVLKTFQESIKDVNYIKIDFDEEIEELNKISKLNIYNLSNLDNNSYYKLFGSETDYSSYKESIEKIQSLLKTLEKEHEVYL